MLHFALVETLVMWLGCPLWLDGELQNILSLPRSLSLFLPVSSL